MKILIYGAGRTGIRYLESLPYGEVIGFLETVKKQETFRGYPVYDIKDLKDLSYDEIHLANVYVDTLYELIRANVVKNKIVIGSYRIYIEYARREGVCDFKFTFPIVATSPMLKLDSVRSIQLNFAGSKVEANLDYIRHNTLKLLIDEIRSRNIPGDMAELGVFQGNFASLLNELMPERTLHLFDTFTGFAEQDREYEIKQGYTKEKKFLGKREFSNTSVELVLSKMCAPQKCVVHKGYFPFTIPAEEKKYALVSLDCDLYAPMLAGLRYFVPRLSKGGYIMMHDYNDEDFRGNRNAVEECEKEFGHFCKVPIPDCNGSLIISR